MLGPIEREREILECVYAEEREIEQERASKKIREYMCVCERERALKREERDTQNV